MVRICCLFRLLRPGCGRAGPSRCLAAPEHARGELDVTLAGRQEAGQAMNHLKRKNTEKFERNHKDRPTCPLTGLKEITSKCAFFAFLFHFYSFVPITLQIMSGVETSLCHVVLGVYWAWTRVPVHGKG